jgi:hypothetical protein
MKSSLVHGFRAALAVVVCVIERPSLAAEPVAWVLLDWRT